MENDDIYLNDLWKSKKSRFIDYSYFVNQFKQIEKKAKLDRIKLLILIPVITIWLSYLFSIFDNHTYIVAISFITSGLIFILVQNYKNKPNSFFPINNLDNITYAKLLLSKLEKRLKISNKYLNFSALLMVIGFDIIAYEAFKEFNFILRFTFIIIFAVLIPLLINKRKEMYVNQIKPIIDNLKIIIDA